MVSSVSPKKGSINTAILEGHVKDVISSAKTKIQELQRDIEMLTKEYENVSESVNEATSQKKEVVDKNKQL